jgi:hypothetical protein
MTLISLCNLTNAFTEGLGILETVCSKVHEYLKRIFCSSLKTISHT